MHRTFKITAAKTNAVVTLCALAAFSWLLVYVAVRALPTSTFLSLLIVAPVIAIGLLMAWFAVAQRQSTVSIRDRQVVIKLPLYGRTMALEEIDASSLAKLDLSSDQSFRLQWRTNGLGIPGYNLGWFRTRGAGKALAALTGTEAVKWTTTGGYSVLLSLDDADGFLAALHEALPRA